MKKVKANVRTTCIIFVTVILLLTSAPFASEVHAAPMTMAQFNQKLELILREYGSKYNDNKPKNHSDYGYQCFGFANELCDRMIGSYPTKRMSGRTPRGAWTMTYGVSGMDKLRPGAHVRYRYHSIFITKIVGETVYFCDANSNGNDSNNIRKNASMSKSALRTRLSEYLYHDDPEGKLKGWVAIHPDLPDPGIPDPPVPPAEPLVTPADNFLARILTTDSGRAIVGSDGNVLLRNSDPNDVEQYWRFIKQDDGSYKIRGHHNLVIDVADAIDSDGTNIQLCIDHDHPAQEWKLHGSVSDFYMRPNMSVRVLDCAENVHGSNVHLWQYHGAANQRFKLDIQRQEALQVKTDGLYEFATFSVSTDNPVFYSHLFVYKDNCWTGERVISERLNSKTVTRSLAPGTYEAYFDYGTGGAFWMSNVVRFTVNAYQPPINVVLKTSSSQVTEGETLTFTATADNVPTSYKLTIKDKNGQNTVYNMTNGKISLNDLKAGTYTAYATASNQGGSANSPSKSFTVLPKPPINVVLKTSSSQVTEGETLTFTATADNVPTSYKLTIKDKNGQNTVYNMTNGKISLNDLKAGTYTAYATASNQGGSANSTSKSFTVLPKPPINVVLKTSSSQVTEGETLTFTATADNAPTSYKLTIKDKNGQNTVYNMTNGKISLNDLKAGTYTAYATASNQGGSANSPSKSFTVLPKLKPLKITVFRAGWSDTYEVGQTIDLAARGEGGTAPYKYQFYVLRSNGNRVNFRKDPVSSNIYPWTPVTPSTYTLGVDVYDAAGNKVTEEKRVTVTNNNPFSIAVFRAGWSDTYELGQTIDLAARGEGGTAPYKYQFYVLRSNGKRVNFRKDPVSSNIYPWTPVTPDTYTLGVDVYDATGRKMTAEKTITVTNNNPFSVAVFRAGWSDTYEVGQTIDLAARGEGGTGPYKYQFYVLRSNGNRVNFRKDPVSSNIYPWTPVTPDTYTIGVDIYDATGRRATAEKTITVR